MIPYFPEFVKLLPSHKKYLKNFTNKFPPYSDHDYTSLIMWDVSGTTEFSNLNNNLVVKFKDYESDRTYYSFIGNKQVKETIETLLEYSVKQGMGNELMLLPKDNFTEEEISELSKKYHLEEDRDNFDYILSVEELASFAGGKYLNKRNKLNHFLKNHNPKIVIASPKDSNFQKELIECLKNWAKTTEEQRGAAYVNLDELKAFKRLIEHHQYLDVLVISVYVDGEMKGFSIVEILENGYAQHPFQKADIKYKGIYEFINHNIAKFLKEKGVKHINSWQDLGEEGLRNAKMDYNPSFLIKYKMRKKSAD